MRSCFTRGPAPPVSSVADCLILFTNSFRNQPNTIPEALIINKASILNCPIVLGGYRPLIAGNFCFPFVSVLCGHMFPLPCTGCQFSMPVLLDEPCGKNLRSEWTSSHVASLRHKPFRSHQVMPQQDGLGGVRCHKLAANGIVSV